MLLEPVSADSKLPGVNHIIYPLMLNQSGRLVLRGDQNFNTLHERRRRSILQQLDYDENGNEVVDTVQLEEMEEYSQSVDDDADDESELSNSIDDDVVISDLYSEIEDYDVHPPPAVTEAKSLQEAEEMPYKNNRTTLESQDAADIDGFSVDKLWEGMTEL